MTESFWESSANWRWPQGVEKLRPMSAYSLVPLLVLWWQPLGLRASVAVGAAGIALVHLLTSALLYRRFAQVHETDTVRLDTAPTEALAQIVDRYPEMGWRFSGLAGTAGGSAMALVPDQAVSALVVLSAPAGGDADTVSVGFVSVMSDGQTLLSTARQRHVVPLRRTQIFFDAEATPYEAWSRHRAALVEGQSHASVEELVMRIAPEGTRPGVFRQAGFWRFTKRWPTAAWATRGVLNGY